MVRPDTGEQSQLNKEAQALCTNDASTSKQDTEDSHNSSCAIASDYDIALSCPAVGDALATLELALINLKEVARAVFDKETDWGIDRELANTIPWVSRLNMWANIGFFCDQIAYSYLKQARICFNMAKEQEEKLVEV